MKIHLYIAWMENFFEQYKFIPVYFEINKIKSSIKSHLSIPFINIDKN